MRRTLAKGGGRISRRGGRKTRRFRGGRSRRFSRRFRGGGLRRSRRFSRKFRFRGGEDLSAKVARLHKEINTEEEQMMNKPTNKEIIDLGLDKLRRAWVEIVYLHNRGDSEAQHATPLIEKMVALQAGLVNLGIITDRDLSLNYN